MKSLNRKIKSCTDLTELHQYKIIYLLYYTEISVSLVGYTKSCRKIVRRRLLNGCVSKLYNWLITFSLKIDDDLCEFWPDSKD